MLSNLKLYKEKTENPQKIVKKNAEFSVKHRGKTRYYYKNLFKSNLLSIGFKKCNSA